MDEAKIKTGSLFFWIGWIALAAAAYAVKFAGPLWVESLFQSGQLPLLQSLTGAVDARPLGFYTGRWNEILFGPLSTVLLGAAFVLLVYRYLLNARPVILGGAFSVYLLATKFEVLFFPPYGDAVGGPFAEALWLAQNGFDYAGLAAQPGYIIGGPKVYLSSIYPTYLALLLKLIPSTKIFILFNHLLVFAAAAALLTFLREIFVRLFSRFTAFLLALTVAAFPLFQSQVEFINMEIPVLFFVVLCLHALVREKFGAALLWSVLATLVKDYGIITCGLVPVAAVCVALRDGGGRQKKALLCGAAALLFAAGRIVATFFLLPEEGKVVMFGWGAGWASLRIFPEFYLFVLSLVIIAAGWGKRQADSPLNWREWLAQNYVPLLFMLCGTAWVVLFLNSHSVAPRYKTLFLPFLVFTTGYAAHFFVRSARAWAVGTAVVLLGLWWGAYGFPCRPVAENDYVLLERSLEYRNDLELRLKIAQAAQQKYAAFTLGAPFIVAQSLALPPLGYVTEKLDILIYGASCLYGGIKNFQGLQRLEMSRTMWVGLHNDLTADFEGYYPVSPYDRVVEEIWVGNKKGVFFVGGIGIEGVWRQVMRKTQQN